MSEHRGKGLQAIIDALFSKSGLRDDLTDLALAKPSQPNPLLVQNAEGILTLALAVELLAATGARRGMSLPSSVLESVRSQIRTRFSKSELAHVEEEVLHILIWLERVISEPDVESDADERPSTETLEALTREAIETQADLFLEQLDEEDGRLKRIRLRPERLTEEPMELTEMQGEERVCVVGRRVPHGFRMTIPLEAMRWMMVVRRFSDLPVEGELAPVLAFPRFSGPKDEG